MISQVSEKKMHLVRWLLAIGWLTLIASLFYDPISTWLTDPNHEFSPFHLNLSHCVKVQGACLPQKTYGMGATIFWAVVLPIGIMTLLVFGHEFWRRICPLYFFSQIPRSLGIQRKRKITNPNTNTIHYELAGVDKESWLGRNYLFLQLGLFYLGLNIRILFVNGDRTAMGIFFLLTIGAAISIGFLYKGKSWCQYFCPMAPVEMFYTGPKGLLGSEAHLQPPQSITQSTCRTVDDSGKEKSACVSCQSPCIDIDAERSYWEGITRLDQKLVFYCYFGLMLGFYVFYFLYAGNWDYYYSGAWAHEEGQLSTLFKPGFYIFDQAIPIPKIVAAPLTLAVFAALSLIVCQLLENAYRGYLERKNKYLNEEQVLHVCFMICTFISFNVFFLFGDRLNVDLLPSWVIIIYNAVIVALSSSWLYRSIGRSKERYSRESLAGSLRRQLNKLPVDWSKLLEGRSLQDLLPEQIYVLAKVLPGVNRADRVRVYKGVLREALAEGNIDSAESLEVLKDTRKELNLSDEEHYSVLTEVGLEDVSLLDPQKQLTRENRLRIESYRRGLELLILELVESGTPLAEVMKRKQKQIIALRQEYAITTEEQEQILAEMFNQDGPLLRTAAVLLGQLQDLAVSSQILYNSAPNPQAPVFVFLRTAVKEKEKLIAIQLSSILEMLGDTSEAVNIARAMGVLAANVIGEILQSEDESVNWNKRLSPRIIASLQQTFHSTESLQLSTNLGFITTDFNQQLTTSSPDELITQLGGKQASTPNALNDVLLKLIQDIDPLVQAASLYALDQNNPSVGFQQANQILNTKQNKDWLLQETAEQILGQNPQQTQGTKVPTLIAQVRVMGKTQTRMFQQPTIQVGRGRENDIVILDNRVSRQHAIFYLDEKGLSVKDLGSSNGVSVGKEYIQNQQKQLKSGDFVRFTSGDDLVIHVQWELRPMQVQTVTEYVSTLEKLFWLYSSSFFQGLNPNVLIELARNSCVRVYRPHEEICKLGKPAVELIVIIDGEATAFSINTTQARTILPGETIGELDVLTHSNYSATVAAGERTKSLAISAKDIERMLSSNSLLSRNLLKIVTNRLQQNIAQTSVTRI
ncbi:FHA domain-containing protein [Aetokthonos hydrillicola Thurmond2011]|jgi:pSer/pThr/pTyr-binding forkhead associated (FHA) protein|uniref:FHA domain-containing protein n=1 Tax=Aetokthonos hydrillicola Thurmond2011 TaxID=2712845 RepID=A0AAP5MA78_9CYAN|nr:FHA domain-containing protein [Aetokthonos hydrillicola]MBO3460381.1 FHA domain-containing protein [Aetokthonos hydrillicola CCALA 1050]MBW4584499.1 FHA domain-containing protein [Aetokthonos hydrillicola CCALA 1050]MDR9896462.1 FHA domain-containing protein [Aetokthonos hydrillicola Thurmond2011]